MSNSSNKPKKSSAEVANNREGGLENFSGASGKKGTPQHKSSQMCGKMVKPLLIVEARDIPIPPKKK